jgi:alpha/beta superfamily hydrolase
MKFILYLSIFSLVLIGCSCKKDESTTLVATAPTDSAFTSEIEFASGDGLIITADHYHVGKDKPVIVLCHQANWSRGEYKEIAVTLNSLGFNCLAIDQRSGNTINGVVNLTKGRAVTAGKPTGFNDAKQDITAAVAWAKNYYSKDVILWGSSYSSALVLIVAKEDANVEKVLSFSPGEYLSPVNVQTSITGLNKPSFLASAKSEQAQTLTLFNVITATDKTQFIPTGNGRHGSSALWTTEADNAEYWVAVKAFLGV